MSQFSSSDFDGQQYDNFRPVYVESFYKYLLDYHFKTSHEQESESIVLDVGCGPGTAVFQMEHFFHNQFSKIIGTDPSPPMIDTASAKLKGKENNRNLDTKTDITFKTSSCMELSEKLDVKVDMITVAEAAHWFLPFKDFLKEAKKVLKPNGTLAIWGYIDPCFVEYPGLDDFLLSLDYGKDYFGEYWEQPGRSILRNLLSDQKIETSDGFHDIEVRKFTAADYRLKQNLDFPLIIKKKITIAQFKGYVGTWSAVNKRNSVLHDSKEVIDRFFAELFRKAPDLGWDTEVTVLWKAVYKLARSSV